jgi:hypothetical protein
MGHGQDHDPLRHGLLDRARVVDVERRPDHITVLIPLVDLVTGTAEAYLRLARERNIRASIEPRPDGPILWVALQANDERQAIVKRLDDALELLSEVEQITGEDQRKTAVLISIVQDWWGSLDDPGSAR